MAYYLLTGRHTFTGNSVMDVLSQSLHPDPEPPSQVLGRPVDPTLEQLILACLSKTPSARPANTTQFLEMLARCQSFGTWTNDHARDWWAEHQPVKTAPVARPATYNTAAGHPDSTVPMTLERVGPATL